MESSHDEALESLNWNWTGAYTVTHPDPGVWLAQRTDTRETLRAETADSLADMIQADYNARPVKR